MGYLSQVEHLSIYYGGLVSSAPGMTCTLQFAHGSSIHICLKQLAFDNGRGLKCTRKVVTTIIFRNKRGTNWL